MTADVESPKLDSVGHKQTFLRMCFEIAKGGALELVQCTVPPERREVLGVLVEQKLEKSAAHVDLAEKREVSEELIRHRHV